MHVTFKKRVIVSHDFIEKTLRRWEFHDKRNFTHDRRSEAA